jgi:GT2 family glycosyltransferase
MSPKISIVIPVNYSPKLVNAINAIAAQSALERVVDILIVGRQETDHIPNLPQLTYLPNFDKPTPAVNRNKGVRHSTGDFICFTDSDSLPKPDWIEKIIRSFDDGTVALAGAVDIPPQMPYWGRCDHYLGFENQAAGIAHKPYLNYAATINFCIRKDIFSSLGGFDESFLDAGGEDREFCWRLVSKGYKIKFVPDAVVLHEHHRPNFKASWDHLAHYGLATSKFRLQHNSEAGLSWQLGRKAAIFPIIGELMSIVRILVRALARPIRQPALLRKFQYLPGMAVLDLAHTLGMLKGIRTHEA